MSPKNIKIAGVIFIALPLLFCIWFYQAPYSTLMSIKEAAQRKDTRALSELVDFQSFRTSLNAMVIDSIANRHDQSKVGNMFAKAMVGALTKPILDAMVTPDSIAAMFSGAPPQNGGTSTDGIADNRNDKVITSRSWEGLSVFKVRVQPVERPELNVIFVMRRDGFRWRLSELEL